MLIYPQFTTSSDADHTDFNHAALKAFFAVMVLWRVRTKEQRLLLGDLPESTYHKWKKNLHAALSRDQQDRIAYILGIYKALQILIPEPVVADSWIHQPNKDPFFANRTPLARMCQGSMQDLAAVRQYLDAQRGAEM